MGDLIEISNKIEPSEGTESVERLTNELLADARRGFEPPKSVEIPIAQLSTLGTGIASIVPALNSVVQTPSVNTAGLYRVVNSGLGELKASKDGFLWGAIKKADGGSVMAKLEAVDPVTATTKTVSGVNPATLMMAAALFSIEQELGKIEDMEKQILSFLEIEKESEIEADIITLNDIIKKYKHSWDNEHFIVSNHKLSCDIQRTARKNMISFQKAVAEAMKEKQFLVAGAKVNSMLQDLQKKFQYYRLSLYAFSMASMLEIMLSGNFKEENIQGAIVEMEKYSDEYRELFTECSSFLESLSKKSIETNVKKGIGSASNALGKFIGNIPKVKDGQLDEFLQEKGEKIKLSAAEAGQNVIGSFAEVSNPSTGIFIEKMRDLDSIYNDTKEICFDKEKIYLLA